MANRHKRVPGELRIHRLTVRGSHQISPNFHRVTVTGDDLASFGWKGFDHWFRLFLPQPGQTELRLPTATSGFWYAQYLAMPPGSRPHVANYTVRAFRAETLELDIDFVIHRGHDGRIEGRAATWAAAATAGDGLAILDQGVLFTPPGDVTEFHLVADETGLPAVESILGSLSRQATGTVVQEVPTPEDRREFDAPEGIAVTWVVREQHPGLPVGAGALATLRRRTEIDPSGYAFVVGESDLATGGRRHLHSLGLAKNRISFTGYWKRAKPPAG